MASGNAPGRQRWLRSTQIVLGCISVAKQELGSVIRLVCMPEDELELAKQSNAGKAYLWAPPHKQQALESEHAVDLVVPASSYRAQLQRVCGSFGHMRRFVDAQRLNLVRVA